MLPTFRREDVNGNPYQICFLDVGCGSIPIVLLQMLFQLGCDRCTGIELDPVRAAVALKGLRHWSAKDGVLHTQCEGNLLCAKLAEYIAEHCQIVWGDLLYFTPAFYNNYTHVFVYDSPQIGERRAV